MAIFLLDPVISTLVSKGLLKAADLKLTLVPRGLIGPDGKEVVAVDSNPRIERISISVR